MKTLENIAKLKRRLKKDGRSLTWFHRVYIGKKISRSAMYQQLNKGYEPCEIVSKAIEKYLKN